MTFVLAALALGLVVIAHELGHALAAQALGLPWSPVIGRRGLGIRIGADDLRLSRFQVAVTASAGPAASLLLAACAWRLYPFASLASAEFAVLNLVLPRSDGAAVLRALRGPFRPHSCPVDR